MTDFSWIPPRKGSDASCERFRSFRNERIAVTAGPKQTRRTPSSQDWVTLLPENTLILLDGFGYIFRAYYSRVSFVTRSGIPTGAFTVFGNMLLALLNSFKPRHIGVVFESRTGNVRSQILPEIKANRAPPPPELIAQIPLIEELLSCLGIPVLSTDGYEADDTIAALAKKWLEDQEGSMVVVLSTDKDLLALVSDRLTVFDPMQQKVMKARDVREKWGVDPGQVSDLLALMGDAADNIGGVPGVGPKTAASLLAGGRHVEDLFEEGGALIPERLRSKIMECRDLILRNKSVTVLHDSIGVDATPETLSIGPARLNDLRALALRLEASSLLDRASEWIERRTGTVFAPPRPAPGTPAVRPGRGIVCDPGTGTGFWDGRLWSWHPERADLSEPLRAFLDVDAPYWVSSLTSLARAYPSCELSRLPLFDLELAGYLADPGRRDYRLGALQSQFFLEGDLAVAEDRERILFDLLEKMKEKIDGMGLLPLLQTVEIPVARILSMMEKAGIRISRDRIAKVRGTIGERARELEQEIFREAGEPFVILSPKQVAHILFEKLGLPTQKKGKTGYSTDEETLEALSARHPLPRMIVEYRQLKKFLSTYLEPMDAQAGEDGRIHGHFNQTVAATGRLSSSDPNLQNIPVKGDLGLLVRRCFVATEGAFLLSADYSQIELRLLAHLSQDPFLLGAFAENRDIHAQTAEALFGSPATSESRRRAKTLNFAILYGMSSHSLSQELGVSQGEAQGIIDRYFQVFGKVGPYFETIRKEALESGKIRTILGRIRPVPEILSENRKIREYGERMAVNSVLQGSAADLIKKAMVELQDHLRGQEGLGRLLLQVHDELLFEVPEGQEERLSFLVRESMEGAMALSVPLVVGIGVGKDWVDAHPA